MPKHLKIWGVIAAGILLGGSFLLLNYFKSKPITTDTFTAYASEDVGLQFSYPKTYVLQTRHDGYHGEEIHVLTILNAKDAENIPDQSEGPPGLSIIEIPTTTPNLSQWLQENSISNFYLSPDKSLSTMTIGGEPAFSYRFSGLYENDAVAVAHNGKIYLFFGSWLSSQDTIRSDFQELLQSVKFY